MRIGRKGGPGLGARQPSVPIANMVAMTAAARSATMAGMRSLRSAPHATIDGVAGAAGVTPKHLRQATAGLKLRGRCAEMAADHLNRPYRPQGRHPRPMGHKEQWLAALRRTCPPSAVRAAAPPKVLLDDHPVVLASRAGSSGWSARTDLALFEPAPSSLLRAKASAVDAGERAAVARRNSVLPLAVLKRLARDPEWAVRHAMATTIKGPRWLFEVFASDESTQEGLALNVSCPPDLLDSLARYGDEYLRRSIAQNTSCSPELFADLVEDEDWDIDVYVAQNPGCPPDLLRKLMHHDSGEVVEAAANNPGCQTDLLRGGDAAPSS